MHLPLWAKKPKHKKNVVPTKKGWVVESTGEVLVSHRNLDTKLVELFSETHDLLSIEEELTKDIDKGSDNITNVTPIPEGLRVDKLENSIKVDFYDNVKDGEEAQHGTEIETLPQEPSTTETKSVSENKEESKEKPKKKRGRPPKKK